MRQYGLFTLYGPMASWGEIAVGEIRGSANRPTRSALIGLLCAALGVERDNDPVQHAVVDSYRFAVKVENQGVPIRDFHTWQKPKPKRGVKWETRREELQAEVIHTGLSSREYVCDAQYTVCLWISGDAPPFSLEAIRSAIGNPRFVLYLGRKACPPGLPIVMELVSAGSVKEAFAQFDVKRSQRPRFGLRSADPLFFWDEDPHIGMDAYDSFTRRDVPRNRKAWQFSERLEHFGGPSIKQEE